MADGATDQLLVTLAPYSHLTPSLATEVAVLDWLDALFSPERIVDTPTGVVTTHASVVSIERGSLKIILDVASRPPRASLIGTYGLSIRFELSASSSGRRPRGLDAVLGLLHFGGELTPSKLIERKTIDPAYKISDPIFKQRSMFLAKLLIHHNSTLTLSTTEKEIEISSDTILNIIKDDFEKTNSDAPGNSLQISIHKIEMDSVYAAIAGKSVRVPCEDQEFLADIANINMEGGELRCEVRSLEENWLYVVQDRTSFAITEVLAFRPFGDNDWTIVNNRDGGGPPGSSGAKSRGSRLQ